MGFIRSKINRWRFSGKEIQTLGGVNLVDFGARLYDDAIVRWSTQDALAEKYSGFSPYCYCSNNPISFMDPDGKDVVDKIAGVLIGVATNIIPGSGSLRGTYSPTSSEDYNNTLERVDDITVKVGIATIGVGTAGAIAGTTATATGGAAAATVVGAPAGIAVAAVGATETAVAVTAVAAGSLLTMNAASNKSAGHYRGKNSSKNERHGDSGRALEKAKKKIQALEAEKQGLPKKEREKI